MTDDTCPHFKYDKDGKWDEKSGCITFICETCKGVVPECQFNNHICDLRRIYACKDHVQEQIAHAVVLLGHRPIVKEASDNICDFYDKEYGKPGHEWADGLHHNPCYYLQYPMQT